MPELPDIALYLHALEGRVRGRRIEELRVRSPFLVRTVKPPVEVATGKTVLGLERVGKRVVFVLEDDLFLVFHLMIAGRFHWRERAPPKGGRNDLAWFRFATGTLLLTEASTRKRASLHVVEGRAALAALDPGGVDVRCIDLPEFRARLTATNRTLKRALTDPHAFDGIGNAYSDEILHRARLSPVTLTSRLDDAGLERLYHATRTVLDEWIERLRTQTGDKFPEKVTAFRPDMAVHGRFKEPCPDCGAPVQRIVYAENETNYCARCQTGGKLLADRALSRLLKKDWPRTLDEWEESRG